MDKVISEVDPDTKTEVGTMQTYSREEILESCIEYFDGDELASQVWINKYALKDSFGNIYEKNPKMMHDRIASELHRIEAKYPNPMSRELIQELLYDFKYIIPQGSPMSGIGNNFQAVSLSNCFVIGTDGPADSYGAIMKIDQEQVQLMKRRGGVGHDLSGIRPKGSPVKNSALTSTGVVPFMERYSNSTREVAQDGRRGALMLSISSKHPDSEEFIDAKMDGTKVTGANVSIKAHDDFMKAVTGKGKYIQQYPIDSDNPKVTKEVDAKVLWKKIIHNAWKSAEPGVLFWDKVISESFPDRYADLGYGTVSTNPCIVGDTLIAVADGRNFVPIKQLMEEGKDVPVYCLDDKGKVAIRTMRHPRVTGYNQKIYKVTIEGNHSVRVTGNHKFRLKDGTYKEAKDLKCGDSLHLMTKWESSLGEIFPKSNSRSSDYLWINNGEFKTNISEHRIIYEQLTNSKIPKGSVIHHKDFNSLNNNISNLQLITKKEHDQYHGDLIRGDKNPYHRMTDEWKNNFASHPGEENPRYIDVSNEEIIENAKKLTRELDRRFSKREWIEYAKNNNLPQSLSKFRKGVAGDVTISKKVSLELGYDHIDTDPRLAKTYKLALENGYDSYIDINKGRVLVTKQCENCSDDFQIEYHRREISFCSHKCSLDKINNSNEINEKRSNTINETYSKKGEETKLKQVKILSDLKFKLGRKPLLKEWEYECKEKGVSYRLKTKHGFQNYKEVYEEVEFYNHKVVSVELDGYEDVYNGTVDEFHNFFGGGFEEKTKSGKHKYLSINQLQCGEIPLCPDDSCRLLAINLFSYVDNPFTKEAKFNFDKFKVHAGYALRLMDDIIDLEIGKINIIIDKIKNDPEDEEVKRVEIQLWQRIQKKCEEGRRTGVGITAEGDMLAALGLRYGTKKATDFAVEVHRTYAIEVFRSSNNLAKERGCFKVWDSKREQNHPFLERIREYDEKLYKSLMKYGRRNIACLTIAPTGTVSLMAQTTSGIEPAFMVAYKRRRKINPNDKSAKTDFIDEVGDHWEEYNVYHHGFEKWIETVGYKHLSPDESGLGIEKLSDETIDMLISKSPYYKGMANDVNWVEKVKMQGKIQQWIDHSISVTVNLPEHVDEELVNNVYVTAWKAGCKGCTIYRDGSRSGVLISKGEKKTEELFKESNAPKRPKSLDCSVMTFMNKGEKWIGFLGLLDNKPYEIFTGAMDNFPIPTYVEGGKIVRTKNPKDGGSDYDFVYQDKRGRDIRIPNLNHAFDSEYYDMAKTFSAILRHGMPVAYVADLIEGLNLDGDLISTWKAGVKRMLKRYVKDGTKAGGKTCQDCGSESLEYKEGCLTCMSCGSSKCS